MYSNIRENSKNFFKYRQYREVPQEINRQQQKQQKGFKVAMRIAKKRSYSLHPSFL